MQPQNGTGQDHRALEDRLDAFRDGVSKLIDRIISKPAGEPSPFKAVTGKATETIKAHPLAAAAFVLGLGYLVVRIVRR
jgi:hypothetical protein